MKRCLGGALATVLMAVAGCGSSASIELPPGGGAFSPPALSGTVRDERGVVQQGALVIAQERKTRQTARVTSGADGSFQMSLAAGVYDVMVDREADQSVATSYYGPISINSSVQEELVLRDSGGRGPEQVFGKIFLQTGVPAASRQIILRPGAIMGDAPDDAAQEQVGVVAGDGSFSLSLATGSESALDLEVFDDQGALDEFIDIGKREKPCYVEFAVEQSPVENVLRCNLADPPPAETPRSVLGQIFNFSKFDTRVDGAELYLENGLLTPPSDSIPMSDIVNSLPGGGDAKLIGVIEFTNIAAEDGKEKGYWFWRYAVEVNPDRDTVWHFTDETDESYSLYCFNTANKPYHVVNYNSGRPALKVIRWHLTI